MNDNGSFELQDHTADIALCVRAPSIDALFITAADGLYATIGEIRHGKTTRRETFELKSGDREGLRDRNGDVVSFLA